MGLFFNVSFFIVLQQPRMPKKTMKRKPFDPYDTTNLGRQVKTVVVAVLACSVMLASYTVVVAVVSSIEPDLSAMLLDGIMTPS